MAHLAVVVAVVVAVVAVVAMVAVAGRHGDRRQKMLRATGTDGLVLWPVNHETQCRPIPRSAS